MPAKSSAAPAAQPADDSKLADELARSQEEARLLSEQLVLAQAEAAQAKAAAQAAQAAHAPPHPSPPKFLPPKQEHVSSSILIDIPCFYLYDRSGWPDFKRALNECGLSWNLPDWMTTIVHYGKFLLRISWQIF